MASGLVDPMPQKRAGINLALLQSWEDIVGPAIGAIAVGFGQSYLSEQFPNNWVYFQGALFIVVILLLPGGISSLSARAKGLRVRRPSLADKAAPAAEIEVAA